MFRISRTEVKNKLECVSKVIYQDNRFKFKSRLTPPFKENDYSKTLNMPNSGKFELTMKNVCLNEENIKQVDVIYN